MKQLALAELLTRRKELREKVDQLRPLKTNDIFYDVVERVNINNGTDEIRAKYPRCSMAQLTVEYDGYASKLRRLDNKIQKANWDTIIDVDDDIMENYVPPEDAE